jgi:hypothetical protein
MDPGAITDLYNELGSNGITQFLVNINNIYNRNYVMNAHLNEFPFTQGQNELESDDSPMWTVSVECNIRHLTVG